MDNKKIYITRAIPDIALKMLRDKGYEVDTGDSFEPPKKKHIIKALKQKKYDAVISLLTDEIDSEIYDASPATKIFANYAVGYNNIDIEEAKKRGIMIANTAGTSDESVAEHTFAIMLALLRRIPEADRFVREGKYKGWCPLLMVGEEISGKTIGIVGAGKIGQSVAKKSKAFDMKINYYDITRDENFEKESQANFCQTLEALLNSSDIVSLHVPLLPSTKHLINKETLSKMKKGSFLINTSRGQVVDEIALYEALKSGYIKGAGLDVFEFEPEIVKGLRKMDNVIMTPHCASSTIETRNEMAILTAENIISFFENGQPKARVV